MKLLAMERLPRNAGAAVLEFGEPGLRPRVEGVVIRLPYHDEAEFYWLENGRQFLLVIERQRGFLGGTNPADKVFVIPVLHAALARFKPEEELTFYETVRKLLTPWEIATAEQRWGSQRLVRWGGLLFYALPFSWGEFHTGAWMTFGRELTRWEDNNVELFSPKCRFWGERFRIYDNPPTPVTVVGGRVEIYGRQPLTLKEPHLVANAEYLCRLEGEL